jgi:hypothetical protein
MPTPNDGRKFGLHCAPDALEAGAHPRRTFAVRAPHAHVARVRLQRDVDAAPIDFEQQAAWPAVVVARLGVRATLDRAPFGAGVVVCGGGAVHVTSVNESPKSR